MSWAGAGGPPHQFIIWWAVVRPGPSNFSFGGPQLGPAHQLSEDGPRPDPANHVLKNSRPGPARPINVSNNLGPALPMTLATRPMRHGLHRGRPVIPVGRTMCGPVLEFARICAHVFFLLLIVPGTPTICFSFVFSFWIRRTCCFRPMKYRHPRPKQPTARSDGLRSEWWTTTSLCCGCNTYLLLQQHLLSICHPKREQR